MNEHAIYDTVGAQKKRSVSLLYSSLWRIVSSTFGTGLLSDLFRSLFFVSLVLWVFFWLLSFFLLFFFPIPKTRPSTVKLKSQWGAEIVNLMEEMWVQEPKERPSMTDVVNRLEELHAQEK